MFEAWFTGFFIFLILTVFVLCITGIAGLINWGIDDYTSTKIKRFAACAIVVGPLLGVIWPLTIVGGVASLVGYSLFTTARVIRHRSLDF